MFLSHSKICLFCLIVGVLIQIWGSFEYSLIIWSIGSFLILLGPFISHFFSFKPLTYATPIMAQPKASQWKMVKMAKFVSICKKQQIPRKKLTDSLLSICSHPLIAIWFILIFNIGLAVDEDGFDSLISTLTMKNLLEPGVVLLATTVFNLIFMRRPIFYIIYEQTPEDRYAASMDIYAKFKALSVILDKIRFFRMGIEVLPQVELMASKHQIATLNDFRFHIRYADAVSQMLCAMLSISVNKITANSKTTKYPYAYLVYVFKGERCAERMLQEIHQALSNIVVHYGSSFTLNAQYQDGNVVYVIRKSEAAVRSYYTNECECALLMDIANVIGEYFSVEKARLESLR